MAITTVEKVKTILQISDTSKDFLISEMIPLIEDLIQNLQGYNFKTTEDGSTIYPIGYELIAIRMINYNFNQSGVESERLGDYSVSFTTDYPAEILRGIKKKVKFV